jgi:integrase
MGGQTGLRWESSGHYHGITEQRSAAVRKSDIREHTLTVRHSWSWIDKLKSTKNREERKLPLLPEVREKLLELLAENPHKQDNPFVFYDGTEDEPVKGLLLLNGLKAACKAAKINYLERNIVFHSHRHYYAARTVDRMNAEQVRRITGHKSMAVCEEYADHVINENLE